jgi:hypothetical protein
VEVETATPLMVMVPEVFSVPPINVAPEEATSNSVVEFIWKLRKSPL